jgi:hypothetical protein
MGRYKIKLKKERQNKIKERKGQYLQQFSGGLKT